MKVNFAMQLNDCWNDAFRRTFGFKRYESVKEIQCFCGELSTFTT